MEAFFRRMERVGLDRRSQGAMGVGQVVEHSRLTAEKADAVERRAEEVLKVARYSEHYVAEVLPERCPATP